MGKPPMKNVDFFITDDGTIKPYQCIADFILSHDEKECISAPKIKNCRRLTKNKTECAECIKNFYFDGTKCVMKTNL